VNGGRKGGLRDYPSPMTDWKPATPPLMFNVGLEYYVTARTAVFHDHYQVAGNLFHHAFEMMLKGLLFARSVHVPQVLRQHRHNLPWFWSEVLPILGFDGGRFDEFIEDLHRWELVRFGDFPEGKTRSLQIEGVRYKRAVPMAMNVDLYLLCLVDADELFMLLTREMAWPAQYVLRLIGAQAMEDYKRQNDYVITGRS
jgi:hypothetical protein